MRACRYRSVRTHEQTLLDPVLPTLNHRSSRSIATYTCARAALQLTVFNRLNMETQAFTLHLLCIYSAFTRHSLDIHSPITLLVEQ